MVSTQTLSVAFRDLYGCRPQIYRAPGRVNLIGEHTDYNEGFVLPAAIDRYTFVAVASRSDRRLLIRSQSASETASLDLDELPLQRRGHWSDYPFGVAVALEQSGHSLRGANILVGGNVPIGSGLSSSAALEVVTGFALLSVAEAPIDRLELARLCQRSENEFVGMRCGLMDQFISCFGQPDQALMLDCRSLEYTMLPLPEAVKLVVCDTMVKHELAGSKYNARRAECEAGVRLLAEKRPGITALRDVSVDDLEGNGGDLSDVLLRRCRHVVTENQRVVAAAAALQSGDLAVFGQLMGESHRSLRDDFEVSCAELDLMVTLASDCAGVYGSRMTGGGFGGCTISLVAENSIDAFKETVANGHLKATGRQPEIYVCSAAQGVARVGPMSDKWV